MFDFFKKKPEPVSTVERVNINSKEDAIAQVRRWSPELETAVTTLLDYIDDMYRDIAKSAESEKRMLEAAKLGNKGADVSSEQWEVLIQRSEEFAKMVNRHANTIRTLMILSGRIEKAMKCMTEVEKSSERILGRYVQENKDRNG